MVLILLVVLALAGIGFAGVMVVTARRRGGFRIGGEATALGAVTNFFDTLGIGSFAPTTAWIKLRRLAPDSHIPAILICGHALPTVAQGLIYITIVEVDPALLVACIAASTIGAVLGAPVVLRLRLRTLQLVVGIALLLAATAFTVANLGLMPAGGTALALPPARFAIAVAGSLVIGALMTAGIGFYAPLLAMFSLLGLNPVAVFPIMAGAGAVMMPASGLKFLNSDRIDFRLVLSLALGGIPAVLVAAYIVKSLPLAALRWVVVVVVLYTAAVMLRAATAKPTGTEPP